MGLWNDRALQGYWMLHGSQNRHNSTYHALSSNKDTFAFLTRTDPLQLYNNSRNEASEDGTTHGTHRARARIDPSRSSPRKRKHGGSSTTSGDTPPSPSPPILNAKRLKFHDDIGIKPLYTLPSNHPEHNPLIPEPPFNVICVGPTRCGKTNVIANLLKNKRAYLQKFDRIYIFCPYAESDPVYKTLSVDRRRVYTEWDESDLKRLVREKTKWCNDWNNHLKDREEYDSSGDDEPPKPDLLPPPRDLWIVDDSIITETTNPNKIQTIDELFTVARKLNICVWYIGHRYKRQCTRIMRMNRTHGIYFGLENGAEVKDLQNEECPPWMTKKEFARIYNEATSKPFSFLYINTKAPRELRFSRCFEEVYVCEPGVEK